MANIGTFSKFCQNNGFKFWLNDFLFSQSKPFPIFQKMTTSYVLWCQDVSSIGKIQNGTMNFSCFGKMAYWIFHVWQSGNFKFCQNKDLILWWSNVCTIVKMAKWALHVLAKWQLQVLLKQKLKTLLTSVTSVTNVTSVTKPFPTLAKSPLLVRHCRHCCSCATRENGKSSNWWNLFEQSDFFGPVKSWDHKKLFELKYSFGHLKKFEQTNSFDRLELFESPSNFFDRVNFFDLNHLSDRTKLFELNHFLCLSSFSFRLTFFDSNFRPFVLRPFVLFGLFSTGSSRISRILQRSGCREPWSCFGHIPQRARPQKVPEQKDDIHWERRTSSNLQPAKTRRKKVRFNLNWLG